MPKQYTLFNYRRNLVAMLIFLQLLTVATILILSRVNTDRILIGNAYDAMAKTITQSVDHTRSFIAPAYNTIDTIKVLANNTVINFDDIEIVEKLFFTELTANKNFAGIYIANSNGEFIYMLRHVNSKPGNTSEETYQTKIISNNASTRNVIFKWRKNNFMPTRQEPIEGYGFNPKLRPWYQLAVDAKQTVWTKPYTFFTSKKRGVTIATPFHDENNNVSGVIGIDIEIGQLSNFLDRINQNDDYIRIMDSDSDLIADSKNINALTYDQVEKFLPQQDIQQKNSQGTFKEKKDEYLFVQSLLKSNPSEPNWKVFSYAKTSPFLEEVRSIEKRNLLIALLTLAISILISLLIARKTSKPVENWMNQATTDSLTNLYNRHYFFNSGNAIYSNYTKVLDHHLAIMMIDVDVFKRINDDYGHSMGDEVLIGVSDCISALIESDDLLARFGGEEFILLSKVDSNRQATQYAERIRQTIEDLNIRTNAGIINITVSIGVSVTSNQRTMSFMEFIDTADKALYNSKNNGRNQVSLAKDDEILSNANITTQSDIADST